MIYDIKTGVPYSAIPIKKGQTDLFYKLDLHTEDYKISGFASWKTTVQIVEKTGKGFKLKFDEKCPKKGGTLYLNIHNATEYRKKRGTEQV